jgi:uncharacterized protein (TIGR00106 family)
MSLFFHLFRSPISIRPLFSPFQTYATQTKSSSMWVTVDLCVIPLGVGLSCSPYIAECEKILTRAKLSHTLHPFGTCIEGEWDDVFCAIKECHTILHEMGVPRIHTALKVGTRVDKHQTLEDKVDSVVQKLGKED